MSRYLIELPAGQQLPVAVKEVLASHHLRVVEWEEWPETEPISPALQRLIDERGGGPPTGIPLAEAKARIQAILKGYE